MGLENRNGVQESVTQRKINKVRLLKKQYTISLFHEGLRVGVLNFHEISYIQGQLMLILKDLIQRYTRGESSSVTTDTAQSILCSILYAIDAYLYHLDDPDQAIQMLKKANIKEIYEKGVEVVRQCFEETKQLYREVRKQKLDVAVDAYNLTIDESIPVFLKNMASYLTLIIPWRALIIL